MAEQDRLGLAQAQALKVMKEEVTLQSRRELSKQANVSYDTIDRLVDRGLLKINSEKGNPHGSGQLGITKEGYEKAEEIWN